MILQSLLHFFISRYLRWRNRTPRVVHAERLTGLIKGPLLIVSNHVRAMDPFYIGTILPLSLFPLRYFIARWFQTPFLLFFAIIGIIPLLSRIGKLIIVQKGRGIEENTREAIEKLREGGVVGIFPEGKRNLINEELGQFKYGAAAIAYHAKTPVLPLFITFPNKTIERATIIVGDLFYIETSNYNEGTASIREKLLALRATTKL